MEKTYLEYFDRKFSDIDKRFDKLESRLESTGASVSLIKHEHEIVKQFGKIATWGFVSALAIYQSYLKLKGHE